MQKCRCVHFSSATGGCAGRLPENSLEAFSAAFEAGLDGVEFDVQRSRDGKLFIFHNFELEDGRLGAFAHPSGVAGI